MRQQHTAGGAPDRGGHGMDSKHLQTPALILDMDVFEKNMAAMNALLVSTRLKLRPHYKSSKCTAIAHMQIEAGAIGLCCAKLSEAEDLADAGIEDILIANQVTDRAKVNRVARLAQCCRLTVCVDSAQNIADLAAAAAYQGSTVHCLVEYEIGMRRCGVETKEEVYALARQIADSPGLVFDGIQAYAGHLSHEIDYRIRQEESIKIEIRLRELLDYLQFKGLPAREVSGVSTGTVEFRQHDTVYTEIQAGSYIFMDAAYNLLNLPFENSLFVLSTVMSANQYIVVADAGRKSVSIDQQMPVFRESPHAQLRISEEHSAALAAECPAAVGDKVHIIPGHCCTTVNLHDWLYLTRQGKVIDKVPVISRGKSY